MMAPKCIACDKGIYKDDDRIIILKVTRKKGLKPWEYGSKSQRNLCHFHVECWEKNGKAV